ncbi:SapC family protein [Aurantiacibacter poecillastricola]|uniref:SapC family protein n=1 Tax=Aurantiacibacter poecillastricola TaxID=3064385 RepID=UPI00273E9237|nr:SapC family protein [Aurantiacibacter sp. 219JJ12-13]MDP5260883.1 SapC family protein [Aurantiacibacter sp. 219JJ12-13]
MPNVVPLDNVAHADLKVHIGHGAAFGSAVNQIAVLPGEFAGVQRDCPILFRKGEQRYEAVAILGFERDSNLFLSGAQWQARYIPALARTGPFRLGEGAQGDPVVLVDLDHSRIAGADDEDAASVFLPHGGHAPALDMALAALRIVHGARDDLQRMSRLFDELSLPEPVNLTVTRASGQEVRFDGYYTIGEDRLAALSPEQLGALNAADMLAPVIHAAASLANFNTLLALDGQGS